MDIEDLIKNVSQDQLNPEKNNNIQKSEVSKKQSPLNPKEQIHKKPKNNHQNEEEDLINTDDVYHKNIPGIQKVHIKTYGCSHNASDSEYMAGILFNYGYDIVSSISKCDICIINSCTVKNPSQDAFMTYVNKCRQQSKPVIVAGCVPQGDRNIKGIENISVIGVNQIDRIVEVVEETLKGNVVKLLSKKTLPSLSLPKIRRNELIEIVPINQGCLGSCTYCKTKHARGKLTSYPPEDIVNACKYAWEHNAKEIWITSEDTGVYGRDINTNLPDLLIKILKDIPSDVMIRIGMANPPYIMEHVDKMCKILKHPNVYSFIHIPVQAGSNAVLDKMIREYRIEDFYYVCDYIKKNVPNVTIATDIICGFPTETKEDFEETLNLIRKYKFPVINISQFYPRPGTVAAKWKKVDSFEVKRRSSEVTKLFNSYPNYEYLFNTKQRVWLHDTKEEAKNEEGNFMVGHTKSYAKVLIKKEEGLLGKEVIVFIKAIHKWHVYGEIIDRNPVPEKVDYLTYFKGMFPGDNFKGKTQNLKEDIEWEKHENVHSLFTGKEFKELKTIYDNNNKEGRKMKIVLYFIFLIALFMISNLISKFIFNK